MDSSAKPEPEVRWIDAAKSPWRVPVLDIRPITLRMLSTSKDPRCAANAISFQKDDGTDFVGVKPASNQSVSASLRFRIERFLVDGVLFTPSIMEHKWAIFFHSDKMIFVRSWLRQVLVVADVALDGDFAVIHRIKGTFIKEDEEPDFTVRVTDFLIRTHAMSIRFPAPLARAWGSDPRTLALGCMGAYGKLAEFAAFESIEPSPPPAPLRTNSLLHITVARGDRDGIVAQLDAGIPADLLAQDGLSPVHWAIAGKEIEIAELLLARGCPVDARSNQGATPLMNAIQAGSPEWTNFFLSHGADPSAQDARGFTALHRAAEQGRADLVHLLIGAGARPGVEAAGHTPLSLARQRNRVDVIQMLQHA
jgi:hypothetical protein